MDLHLIAKVLIILFILISGLGIFLVIGLIRFPKPAPNIIAFFIFIKN